MNPQINLRQIEAFRSVMIAGSVVGAAKLLSVTQPSVSRTIGLLESRLGYDLFERRGRRLFPTAEAEALYREIEHTYAGIERINQIALDIRHHRAGALRVAVLPALGQWLAPKAIARFLGNRPEVSVFVQSLPSRQIADLVATRQFDLGVVELPLSKTGVEVHPLPPARTMAIMRRDHSLVGRAEVSLKDLAGERMVLPSPHSYIRYQIDDAFTQLGIAPKVVIETPTSPLACALVAAGAGITLVSRWAAMPYREDGIVAVPVKQVLHSQYGVIFPSPHSTMIMAQEFAALLREMMEDDSWCELSSSSAAKAG